MSTTATWHGWASLDSATLTTLLATDTDALRTVWDASQRVTLPTPTRRDGTADPYVGTAQDSIGTADDGHAVETYDDSDAALTDEWDALTWDEWTSDDKVTCWASVRLTMGEPIALRHGSASARSGYDHGRRFIGWATGEAVAARRLRRAALRDAQAQAQAARTAARASLSVLGRDDDARGAGWIDSDTYRQVRGAVMRHVFGNAAKRDRQGRIGAEHVRAGIAGHGIPVDAHAVDDATQNACLILRRWVTDAMPESLALIVADADTDSACRALIGAAARDGLRLTTQHKRPTALASARAAYAAQTTARVTADAPISDRAAPVRLGSKGQTTGRGYIAASTDSLRTDALLARLTQRDRQGRVAHPSLLALFLADGNVDECLRSLGRTPIDGRPSGAARRALLTACRAEWDALTDGRTADDSAEWVDSLTYAR